MSEADEDVAVSLVDALARQGEYVDDGRFTLDPAAAYRKLRDHQLADPQEYLLLLVEAAWLAASEPGRGQVQVTTGSTITVEFWGVALARGCLRELFTAVLGGSGKLEGEALRHARVLRLLGLAANNALALGPDAIRIQASDDSGASERLEIAPDATLTLAPGETLRPRTIRFSVDGSGLDRSRARAARGLLAQRCRLTQFRVVVDGELVSRGPRTAIRSAVPIMLDDKRVGLAGPAVDPSSSGQSWIINRGVMIQDWNFAGPPEVMSMVEVDLPMDLSRRQFLEGPELHALRQAITAARQAIPERQRPPSGAAKEGRSGRPPSGAAKEGRSGRPPSGAAKVSLRSALLLTIVAGVVVGGGAVLLRSFLEQQREERAAEVARFVRRSCEAGNVESCMTLLDDHEPEPELLDLSCRSGHKPSCDRYLELVRSQTQSLATRDSLRLALLYSCRASPGPECLEAAWFEYYEFVDPEADEPSITLDFILLEDACKAKVARACKLRPLPELRTACKQGDKLACYSIGVHEQALASLERACELGLPEGCTAAGAGWLWGLGPIRDLGRAERNFESACKLGHRPGCEARDYVAELRASDPERNLELDPKAPRFPAPTQIPAGAEPWTP